MAVKVLNAPAAEVMENFQRGCAIRQCGTICDEEKYSNAYKACSSLADADAIYRCTRGAGMECLWR